MTSCGWSRHTVGTTPIGETITRNLIPIRVGNYLNLISGISTRGRTNNFKIWGKGVLASIPAHRRGVFDIAMGILVEAFVKYHSISQAASTWLDRTPGEFSFESPAMAATVPRMVRLSAQGMISQQSLSQARATNRLTENWDLVREKGDGDLVKRSVASGCVILMILAICVKQEMNGARRHFASSSANALLRNEVHP